MQDQDDGMVAEGDVAFMVGVAGVVVGVEVGKGAAVPRFRPGAVDACFFDVAEDIERGAEGEAAGPVVGVEDAVAGL